MAEQKALHFLNTTYADLTMYHGNTTTGLSHDLIERSDTFIGFGMDNNPVSHADTVPRVLSLLPTQRRAEGDSMLLSYFESVICSSSTFLDDLRNPYRHVLLPMALQSQGLFHATLAISANTLRLTSPGYGVLALEHQREALKSLICLINDGNKDTKTLDEILGLALMLCWFDISDGCQPSWIKHLRGFRGLLAQHQQGIRTGEISSGSLERFFTQYFLFHAVLAKTTFHADDTNLDTAGVVRESTSQAHLAPPSPEASSIYTRNLSTALIGPQVRSENISPSTSLISLYLPQDNLDEVDLYMGFSNALLLLLNEITELHISISQHNTNTMPDKQNTFLVQARRLKRTLDKVIQQPPLLHSVPHTAHKRLIILAVAETYRIGALLFLHEVLTSTGFHDIAARVFRQHDRKSYTTSILELIDNNKSDIMHMAVLPLWPLFIAGCCADADTDRVRTIEIFELAEQQQRFGNIAPAHKVVETTWRQRDLGRDASLRFTAVSNATTTTTTQLCLNTAHQTDLSQGQRTRRSETGPTKYEWERTLDMLGGWKISLT